MRQWMTLLEDNDVLKAFRNEFFHWRVTNTPGCYIDFMPGDEPNELEVDGVSVEPELRGQGLATKAFTKLVQLADQYGVLLTLLPAPNDEDGPGLGLDDLHDFYAKFGFKWEDIGMMVRHPKGEQSLTEGQDIPDTFRPMVRDGFVEVWRAIRAAPGFLNDLYPGDSLGIYWSHDRNGAVAYDASRGGHLYRLHAKLPADSIDWAGTTEVHGSGENEIRALNHRPVILLGVDWIDETGHVIEADLKPNLRGKTMRTGPRG